MGVVVKEMSHLFQFFPDEVQPLQYPSHQDLVDQTGDLEINEPCSRIYFNDPINMSYQLRMILTCGHLKFSALKMGYAVVG